MGRRERWRLWLTHLPYTLRRWLRPLSRAGLGAWPGPLLWFAAVVVLVGVLWVVPIVPSPGWPPTWDGEPSESRVQLASMILSGVAAFGVVLSIAAGIAEVNKVFPKQQIHFGTGCTWDETGRLVSALTVVNGDAFVEFPRVTAFAEIVKTQGALAVASSPRGRPGRCGGRARGRGACGGDPRRENHVRRDGADRRGGSVVSSRSIAVRAGHRHLLVAPRTRLRDAPRALDLDGAASLTPPELSTSRSSTSAARAVLVASSLWRPLG